MTKQAPVYRFEPWLERQVNRDDEIGDYARACSGQGGPGRTGAYFAMSDAAHQARDEFDAYVGELRVQGASGKHRLADVVQRAVERRNSTGYVIADCEDPMKIRSILCLRSNSNVSGYAGDVAVFQGTALADVYLYRLRKKNLVPDTFRVVSMPEGNIERAIFLNRTGKSGVAFCYCDLCDNFQKTYNAIDTDRYSLERHVHKLLYEADTAYRHDLFNGYHDTDWSYFERSKRVEWLVSKVTKSEATVREELREERREIVEKRIGSFYSQQGTWVDIETIDDVAFVIDLLDTDRELYEVRYLIDDEGHQASACYQRAPQDHTQRRAPEYYVRVTNTLVAGLGDSSVPIDSLEELFTILQNHAVKQVVVTERSNVRYLRGDISAVTYH